MTYRVYFRGADQSVTRHAMRGLLATLPGAVISGGEASIVNEQTGVALSLSLDEAPDHDGALPFVLDIPCPRPHVFAIEACRLLHIICDELSLSIIDPNDEGMGEGEPDERWLARGLACASRRALVERSLAGEALPAPLPLSTLHAAWRFNDELDALLDDEPLDLEPPVGPRVFFTRDPETGAPCTAALLDVGPRVLLPEVDLYVADEGDGRVRYVRPEALLPELVHHPRVAPPDALLDPPRLAYRSLSLTPHEQERLWSLTIWASVDEMLTELGWGDVIEREIAVG